MVNDLNEKSLIKLMESIREEGAIAYYPTRLVISLQELVEAKWRAITDPEFARLVLEEFGIDLLED